MVTLKEIKKRIQSIKSTRKTTSAMQLVSSAKLRKAESILSNMLPYSDALYRLMRSLGQGEGEEVNPLSLERPVKKVAIIAFSSDSSLCGVFNANVMRELQRTVGEYRKGLPPPQIAVYTIGKKVYDAVRKTDIAVTENFENLAGKAFYGIMADFAESLIAQFEQGETDRVEMIYHRFKSTGTQELVREVVLPVRLPSAEDPDKEADTDYIFEPSRVEILRAIVPKSIKLQLYTALLNSNVSEYAARMIAMQTATDNADDLISELTVEYNKSRQQAITSELLDLFNGNAG
jgi:F-type H+-transporting ATPase subunit gamma